MTRILAGAITLSLALVLTGCESTQDADTGSSISTGMLNDACPVSGGAVNPDADTAEWNGGTVGFCCNGCVSRWADMSDTDRAAKMAGVTG